MREATEQSFLRILMGDALAAIERDRSANSQASRRDVIRTLFASAEGFVWTYREHIIGVATDTGQLEEAERIALSEKVYVVDERGKVHAQTRYISLPAAVRLSARISQRIDEALELDFGDGGWENFRSFVEIRNRLSHPKVASDLAISRSDVSACMEAFFWLTHLIAGSMESATTAFKTHTVEFAEMLDLLKKGDPEILALYQQILNETES